MTSTRSRRGARRSFLKQLPTVIAAGLAAPRAAGAQAPAPDAITTDTLFCVVTLPEDLALQQAEDADREIRAGRYRGPLHGVPYGIKDLFSAKGVLTTWGARPYSTQVFDYDATVVTRLREAGRSEERRVGKECRSRRS